MVVEQLARDFDVHYFGMHGHDPVPEKIAANATLHYLPVTFDRANPRHKVTRTLLWYLAMPFMALRCRLMGVRLIFIDETIPLTAPILRMFYGRNVAITVMDFFMRIYTQKHPRLHWLRDLVEWIDLQSWKKLPVIFTKVLYTQEFLAQKGIRRDVMHLYRNPVDHAKFHPVDTQTRAETRAHYGYTDDHVVMTHHGILHPNKGNDWILQRLAEIKDDLPQLRFLLIGDGPEMSNLKARTGELHLQDRVNFTGWLPTEAALNSTLASTDIGLVMRIGQETDHFHMTDTLAHEMACGKPILAVNLKGIAEVLAESEAGRIFPANDAATFRMHIKELTQSAAIRQTAGQSSQQFSRATGSTSHAARNIAGILRTSVNA